MADHYFLDPTEPFPVRWCDKHGPLRVMAGPVKGWVMVRRPHAVPFVLHVSDLCNATQRPPHGPFEIVGVTARGKAAELIDTNMSITMTDPMEIMIRDALQDAGIEYLANEGGATLTCLDFYLPGSDVYIEVKQFHSDRIGEQMARAPNVIVAQGRGAVELLARMIRR